MTEHERIKKLEDFISGKRNFEDFIESASINHIRELRKENGILKNLVQYFIPIAKWYCHCYPDNKARMKIEEAQIFLQNEARRIDQEAES